MRRTKIELPLLLPEGLHRRLKAMRERRAARRPESGVWPNLVGDRAVEWTWIAAHMPAGPGRALDLGSGNTSLPLIAAERGFDVLAVDLHLPQPHYSHPSIRPIQGDILELELDEASFDLITNCSTVEHIGLAGRYDIEDDVPNGDLAAMARMRALLRDDGRMLLTVPVGRDAVCAPFFRVYGAERLPRLLDGFEALSQHYWIKDEDNRWRQAEREEALAVEAVGTSWSPKGCYYGLGCVELRPRAASGRPPRE